MTTTHRTYPTNWSTALLYGLAAAAGSAVVAIIISIVVTAATATTATPTMMMATPLVTTAGFIVTSRYVLPRLSCSWTNVLVFTLPGLLVISWFFIMSTNDVHTIGTALTVVIDSDPAMSDTVRTVALDGSTHTLTDLPATYRPGDAILAFQSPTGEVSTHAWYAGPGIYSWPLLLTCG